jgi:hypothetical protein
MFFTAGDGSTLRRSEGDYNPSHFEHRHTTSTGAMLVFVLKWYFAPWTSDVVLNFLFLYMVNREASPSPSTMMKARVTSLESFTRYFLKGFTRPPSTESILDP